MFGLAERLGRTVGELEVAMSARELLEWMAYDTIKAGKAPQTDDEMMSIAKRLTGAING